MVAESSAIRNFKAFSIESDTFELIANRMRRLSREKASLPERYRVRTPTVPLMPLSGTASADRRMLNLLGSFRYPGSTEGLPFRMGLQFSPTQPESPWPRGISRDENNLKSSP